jgi:hypothetical protein
VAEAADTELMEMRVTSWQLAMAAEPSDTELMESRVTSWQLATAPAPAQDLELMESRVTSWQLATAPVPTPVVVAVAAPAEPSAPVAARLSEEKPIQLASAAPGEPQRIILPERRITPPKLIRIEFKGGSFFM